MSAYYNEIDAYCAQWLRNLVAEGLIPAGDVDERSIEDVQPDDLRGYAQCHFFAGIGGWTLALRLAGWPDDRPVWTGSCPCQPFSAAGKGAGAADERHLWPAFYWLIRECRPAAVFGEQVASKAGRLWLAGVRADLEALGYGVGAADLCAAGVGAPHIRQRLWWVADAERRPTERHGHEMAGAQGALSGEAREQRIRPDTRDGGATGAGRVGDALEPRLEGHAGHGADGHEPGREPADEAGPVAAAGGDCGVSDAELQRRQQGHSQCRRGGSGDCTREGSAPWSDSAWIPCADGKARRIEPGIEPLAHGVPARVGKLRAYGNAIVPQVAAEFVSAYLESEWVL